MESISPFIIIFYQTCAHSLLLNQVTLRSLHTDHGTAISGLELPQLDSSLEAASAVTEYIFLDKRREVERKRKSKNDDLSDTTFALDCERWMRIRVLWIRDERTKEVRGRTGG